MSATGDQRQTSHSAKFPSDISSINQEADVRSYLEEKAGSQPIDELFFTENQQEKTFQPH